VRKIKKMCGERERGEPNLRREKRDAEREKGMTRSHHPLEK